MNEFLGPGWSAPASNSTGLTVGEDGLLSFGLFTEAKWIWAGVGFLIAASCFFVCMSIVALKYGTGISKVSAVPDEEELEQVGVASEGE